MNIVPLDKKTHDRNAFDCGEPALNNFLKTTSAQHNNKSLSRTFVLTSDANPEQIKGFYSLAVCTIELDQLPPDIAKKYPSEVHCALLGRLATNKSYQRQGLGSVLLIDAVRKSVEASKLVPTPMIIVDAKNVDVKEWYESFGFTPFPVMKNRLFMTMATAQTMLDKVDGIGL
ncbi:TPA: GNAT family N-acetyltransferase [Vibrio parahaemolyticus]